MLKRTKNKLQIVFEEKKKILKATLGKLIFDGYKKVYNLQEDDEEQIISLLENIKENDKYISSGEKGVEVLLEPGDCMLYLGTECEHWRKPLTDKGCSQVFLHYRETKKVTDDKWDKRLGPGMPTFTKRI